MVSGTVPCTPGSRETLTAEMQKWEADSEVVWTRDMEAAALVLDPPALKPNYTYFFVSDFFLCLS